MKIKWVLRYITSWLMRAYMTSLPSHVTLIASHIPSDVCLFSLTHPYPTLLLFLYSIFKKYVCVEVYSENSTLMQIPAGISACIFVISTSADVPILWSDHQGSLQYCAKYSNCIITRHFLYYIVAVSGK